MLCETDRSKLRFFDGRYRAIVTMITNRNSRPLRQPLQLLLHGYSPIHLIFMVSN